MAMSVGSAEENSPMSDINTTPLVDVMLVLLIIFLITVPVVIQTVPVKLPKVVYEPTTSKPENVVLSIRGDKGGNCEVFWGQSRIHAAELVDKAVAKLRFEIDKQGGPNHPGLELPEVHIRADVDTPWQCVGGAMANVARAGFTRVGFISQPDPGSFTVVRD
jgi:biopolymer transport protein ExbD